MHEESHDKESYETPILMEIGEFADLTSGNGSENEDMTSRYSWW